MSNIKRDKVDIGDWVRGFAKNGALIQGYMENIDPIDPLFKIKVIESDDKDLIGYSINMDDSLIEKMPDSRTLSEVQLQYLIDVALATKDEEWFYELSLASKKLKQKAGSRNAPEFVQYSLGR